MIEKHDMMHEFPEHHDRIIELKASNKEFLRLYNEYHRLDKEIRRVELDIEPASDKFLEERKKLRLHLKDKLYNIIVDSA